MEGKQYTKCVAKADYDGLCGVWPDLLYAIGYGAFGAVAGAVIGVIVAAVAAAAILSLSDEAFQCIALIPAVIGFMVGFADGLQERFENQRLICIAEDQCAIGRIAFHKTGPSKGVPEGIDNDYTVNLILVPHGEDADAATVWNDGAQGQQLLQATRIGRKPSTANSRAAGCAPSATPSGSPLRSSLQRHALASPLLSRGGLAPSSCSASRS
jgi:hypothetical protein